MQLLARDYLRKEKANDVARLLRRLRLVHPDAANMARAQSSSSSSSSSSGGGGSNSGTMTGSSSSPGGEWFGRRFGSGAVAALPPPASSWLPSAPPPSSSSSSFSSSSSLTSPGSELYEYGEETYGYYGDRGERIQVVEATAVSPPSSWWWANGHGNKQRQQADGLRGLRKRAARATGLSGFFSGKHRQQQQQQQGQYRGPPPPNPNPYYY